MPAKNVFPALLLVAGCLLFPLSVQAEDCPSDDLSPVCTDMRAQASFEQADQQLNASYKQLIKLMSVPKSEYIDFPALKAGFIDAQRQWLKFRDKECNTWYLLNQAGAQRNSAQMSCLIQRTKDRTQQLSQWIAELP